MTRLRGVGSCSGSALWRRPDATACLLPPLQVHALGLLRFMLNALSNGSSRFSLAQARHVEERCLNSLGWRLGPWYHEDPLACDDYEQLADAMGLA